MINTEEMRVAARDIKAAADDVKDAAGVIDEAFARHARSMDAWLDRLESLIDRLTKAVPPQST